MDDESDRLGEQAGRDVSEATTLLGHFYRGEMDRVNTWRGRLDRTTNWTVTIMAALLTWVFTSQDNPHYLLLIGILAVLVFLAVDVRRYRTYDVWRARVRLLEEDVFAQTFDPDVATEHEGWRRELADDLRRPALKTPLGEAVGRRLRRIYLPLLVVLLAAWLVRISVFVPDEPVLETASVLVLPGWLVLALVGAVYLGLAGAALWPRERQAKGELYHRDEAGEWKDE